VGNEGNEGNEGNDGKSARQSFGKPTKPKQLALLNK
jgi:hypothetical protein